MKIEKNIVAIFTLVLPAWLQLKVVDLPESFA